MAHVFLSYSRDDRPTAQKIAESLEAEGFEVWWDKVLRAGQTYDEVTEGMLRDSAVVVVLWSKVSAKSKWVRAEATLGSRSSVLVPAMIEECDRPIMFELTHTADLIGWGGDRTAEHWRAFVADIRQAIGDQSDVATAPAQPAAPIVSAPASADPSSDDASIETTFWNSIEDETDPEDFEAYLKRYPEGHFADLARNRLKKLRRAARAQSKAAAKGGDPNDVKLSPSPLVLGAIVAAIVAAAGGGFVLFRSLGNSGAAEAATDTIAEAGPVAGAIKDCDTCPELVSLAPATFRMGSAEDEPNRVGNESPQHEVSLPAYAIGKFEVTFDEWDACVDAGACRHSPSDRGNGRGAMPVFGVSWADTNEYVVWLSRETGRNYRLPTEAEWEYAARGGTETAYWWGDRFDRTIAPSGRPSAVSQLQTNAFELAGTLGNVREWVEDCYVNNYANAPTDGRAVNDGDCSLRVIRGGSYEDEPAQHRAANRARVGRTIRDKSIGFRIATSDVTAR